MLLEARFSNVEEWKAILHAIGDIAEEAIFICNQEGITFRGIDPSHVSLLDITFPRSSFESYDCHATFFGIKVNDLKSIISASSNNDSIEFNIEDPHKMKISIHGSLEMRYDLNLIERSEVNTPRGTAEAVNDYLEVKR